MKGKSISPSEVDFWLDSDAYSNFFAERTDTSKESLVFNIDMVRLSSIRKSISNFVRILTRQNIPVYFNSSDMNVNIGGKVIYLSAKINNKRDYDVAVGLALHEGAHTLKSDFDVVKIAWANIPPHILQKSDTKNISRLSIEKFIHTMCNIVEDIYIDDYVFNAAPGYRGYYVALYEEFWLKLGVDEILKGDLFRFPSLDSYEFRIINIMNENTDLEALPGLEDIARVIDITNISRLYTTKDRVNVAFKIIDIVLDNLDKQPIVPPIRGQGQSQLVNPSDFFDFGDSDDGKSGDGKNEQTDVGKKMIEEMADISSGKNVTPEQMSENEEAVHKISDSEVSKEVQKELKEIEKAQRQFIKGELTKEPVTVTQKALLDLIEKHGIILVQVELPQIMADNDKGLKVDCIVVQKMTKELILSGEDVFPLSGVKGMGDNPTPPEAVADAVKKGITLGTKLGRKLQVRNEANPIKFIRKKWGKINKRLLHTAAFDAEDLFYKTRIEQHNKATIHISVDASGSMSFGNKWLLTMTTVVAICKAASMVDNVHITVSFRSTQHTGSVDLPYVILAYDSKHDKFSKVKSLFPYLSPNGLTPEGLAFGAIMNLFAGITPDEEERYFLNLSDGEPYYALSVPNSDLSVGYHGDVGSVHTKSQVDKIRQQGVEVLSYFIEESTLKLVSKIKMTPEEAADEKRRIEESPLRKNFRKMYGKDAKFIDVESVTDLAKTINEKFLTKKG